MLDVKICGINDADSLQAAVKSGASYVGFVFYPASPRALSVEAAQKLAESVPAHVITVGLFVDPADEELLAVTRHVPLGMLQLHGAETPRRAAALRLLTGLPVIKAFGIATAEDVKAVMNYETDMYLFDAKPSPGATLPGGTGTVFNWPILKGQKFNRPWLLAGGLNAQNLIEAVKQSGAPGIDVSSGVENSPGHKNPDKIRELMALAAKL